MELALFLFLPTMLQPTMGNASRPTRATSSAHDGQRVSAHEGHRFRPTRGNAFGSRGREQTWAPSLPRLDSSLGPLLCHSGGGFRVRGFESFNRPDGACIPSGNAKLHEAGVKHRRRGSRRKQTITFCFGRDVPNRERILANMFSFLLLLLL